MLQKPQTSRIEKELLSHINKERKNRNLTLLIFSTELSRLARRHSQDMADHKNLSHISSSGKTLRERLREEGIYFVKSGENIAFSETFLPDIIHQSLMESPGHRTNIISPEFNQVGIGVINKETQGYYITQNFTFSPNIKSETEAKKIILDKINTLRQKRSLTLLALSEEADQLSLVLSKRLANEKSPPRIENSTRPHIITYLKAATLDIGDSQFEPTIKPHFFEGGIGVWFDKNAGYPGGAYFITILLYFTEE